MKTDKQVREPEILRSAQDDVPQGVRYVGDGEFIPGVPARDLTADEARVWAAVLASPTGQRLYAAGATEVKVEVEKKQGDADV